MSSTQPGRTVKTRRHLHYVLRTGTPEPRTPMFDSVESWNWAVRISVVGLFVVATRGQAGPKCPGRDTALETTCRRR